MARQNTATQERRSTNELKLGRECALCGCKKFESVGSLDRHGYPLDTVICWRCGVVSHANIPTDTELATYYERDYRREYNGEEVPSARRVVREWKRGRERFETLKPFLKPNDEVFEIGAGIGCNLKQFELAGNIASGIEPGPGFSKFSREQLRCDIYQGRWQDLPAVPSHDLVLLVHVLEHLNAPSQALLHIRKMLRPGGRLYIEVPNLAAPHAAPKKLFHYAHIYNYTPWTLTMLARSCGFEVTKLLSAERDRNLAVLLTVGNSFVTEVDPQSYLKTRAALCRYNSFTYHMRASYLRERCREIIGKFQERRTASNELAKILAQCAAAPTRHPKEITSEPAKHLAVASRAA